MVPPNPCLYENSLGESICLLHFEVVVGIHEKSLNIICTSLTSALLAHGLHHVSLCFYDPPVKLQIIGYKVHFLKYNVYH